MIFSVRARPPLPRLLSLAAYALAIGFAGLAATLGAERVARAAFTHLSSHSPPVARPPATARQAAATITPLVPRAQTLRREARLISTAEPWYSWEDRPRRRRDAGFGSSSRGPGSFFGGWGDDDNDDRRERMSAVTYRTVCVRTCDGYYFPVSFATPREGFARDSRTCESKCGGQGRLFAYRNPGGSPDTMEDLQGRPYRQLPTAFLYRTQYVAACKCQADPWEPEAKEKHRVYALVAARNKGSKDAALELMAIEAKAKAGQVAARAAGKVAVAPPVAPASVGGPLPGALDADQRVMGLGANGAAPKRQAAPPPWEARGSPEWRSRALQPW